MKKRAKNPVILILLAACAVFIILSCIFVGSQTGTHSIYFYSPDIDVSDPDVLSVYADNGDVVELDGFHREWDDVVLNITALKQGEDMLHIVCKFDSDDGSEPIPVEYPVEVKVGAFSIMYDSMTGNFSGSFEVALMFSILLLVEAAVLFANFFIRIKKDFYAYETTESFGFGLLLLIVGVVMLVIYSNMWENPGSIGMNFFLASLGDAGELFLLIISPFVAAFFILLIISNIILIKKSGRKLINMLAIIVVLAVLVLLAGVFLFGRSVYDTEITLNLGVILYSIFIGLICYFFCMLIGTEICGFIASKKKPKEDKDYVIILGCRIAKDGRILPHLRDRVDGAVSFFGKQKEKTGREFKFVPSGGQGSDEPISEAESMENYLVGIGFRKEQILKEMKSKNTLENMKFSKKIIEEDAQKENLKNPKVAFATSGYHVFRSGIWAKKIGLKAEGYGCKTRWYYWLNAFLREFIGMVVQDKKRHIPIIIIICIIFGLLSNFY